MKTKNIIHILHPDEFTCAFVVETDGPADVNDLLERVFAEWNNGSGRESELFLRHKVRSLSVGDIVCINGTYHQCLSMGWKQVTPEYVNELERDVAIHPRRFTDGAWSCLNDVMWQRRIAVAA